MLAVSITLSPCELGIRTRELSKLKLSVGSSCQHVNYDVADWRTIGSFIVLLKSAKERLKVVHE